MKPTSKPTIRESSPLPRVRSPYLYVPHLTTPRMLVATIPNHVGGQHMGQRGWPSRPSRNLPTCSRLSRRSWGHSRFSYRTMMYIALRYLALLTTNISYSRRLPMRNRSETSKKGCSRLLGFSLPQFMTRTARRRCGGKLCGGLCPNAVKSRGIFSSHWSFAAHWQGSL